MNNEPIIDENGMSLLGRKWKGGIGHVIFSRLGLIILLFAIQALFLVALWLWLGETISRLVYGGTALFEIIVFLWLINGQSDPTAKISWLILIGTFPLFGTMFYAWTKTKIGHRKVKKRLTNLVDESRECMDQDEATLEALKKRDAASASLVTYMERVGTFPVHQNTKVTYFPLGEKKFEQMLVQLEKAKTFIFLEYFIIDKGLMWGKILEILARKVKEGVDVRVMYDGTCELSTLPANYPKRMQAIGIPCRMFSPLHPFVSTTFNYRDHRKILVIDGQVAFNGGVNLGDEYINHIEKFGHWKDTAVMLEGEAVQNLTLMFLQMWHVSDDASVDWNPFVTVPATVPDDAAGFVMSYGDVPLDQDKVGEMVYMDILNSATDYVHIMSPYLILDGELETALKFTAERGVNVRLILPGIPDKAIPYALARGHYKSLLQSGVKIYEYTPGFVHAKVFVSDDKKAVVGTINLDYRSLYHHFECATYMVDTPCIQEIAADFLDTQAKCQAVSMDTVKHFGAGTKIASLFAKIVAPLL